MRLIRQKVAFVMTVSALLSATPVAAGTAEQARRPSFSTADLIASSIREAAERFDIPERWISAVMDVESAGNVAAISRAGAIGLMQVMPRTYAALRIKLGLAADPYDPRDNIIAGVAYLHELHDRYGDAGFLAAYNAGPRRWEDYLAGVRPLPRETSRYMARLAPQLGVDSPMLPLESIKALVARPETAPIFVRVSSAMTSFGPASVIRANVQLGATAASIGPQVHVLSDESSQAHPGTLLEQQVGVRSTRSASRSGLKPGDADISLLAANPLFVPRTSD